MVSLFLFGFIRPMCAQTETYLIARMGMTNASTYHLLELQQSRGRWFAPDFLYVDYGHNNYRELWVGAGRTLLQSKKISLANGCYFDAAMGPAAKGTMYLLPWTWVTYRLSSRIGGETYYLPYLPINSSGTLQHLLERAKLEYSWKHFKLGAGYAGYKAGSDSWQNKPFITGTLRGGRVGDLELWLQRLPQNRPELQLRYVVSHKSH